MGCRIADHGVNSIPDVSCEEEVSDIFQRAISGEQIFQKKQINSLYMLVFFAVEYAKRDWCMQIHMSPLRNQNAKLFTRLGPIAELIQLEMLCQHPHCRFFNTVESMYTLPKTILYSLNPQLITYCQQWLAIFPPEFLENSAWCAWWFCDHRWHLEQLKIFANTGVLGVFNGMLTIQKLYILCQT